MLILRKLTFYTDEELFKGVITMRVNNKGTLKKLKQQLLKIVGIEKVGRH